MRQALETSPRNQRIDLQYACQGLDIPVYGGLRFLGVAAVSLSMAHRRADGTLATTRDRFSHRPWY